MSIISYIKNFFDKKQNYEKSNDIIKNEYEIDSELLFNYKFKDLCDQCRLSNKCNTSKPCMEFYGDNKRKYNFIVIDDNYGVIDGVKDIVNKLKKEGKISDKWVFYYYYTKQSPIYFFRDIKLRGLIPNAGIVDITYGSILRINNKNIKINGVHIIDYVLKINSKFKFNLYTGNTLNYYLKPIKMMLNFFEKIYNDDMMKYVLTKNFDDEKYLEEAILSLISKVECDVQI